MKMTINEIKERLQYVTDYEDEFLLACQADERKGIQLAVKQWQKRQVAKQKLYDRYQRMNQLEENYATTYSLIAGIDEVGRGPLAGPVVAAAVILDPDKQILGLNDSKKLSLAKRVELFTKIKKEAVAVGIGVVSAEEIDKYNILGATKIAMKKAVSNLNKQPELLLVDAVQLQTPIPQETIIKGDLKSNSIAAASIIAKVTRDEMMVEYGREFPGYGFANNAGYGTKEHLEAMKRLGITPIHRRSFSPVKKYI